MYIHDDDRILRSIVCAQQNKMRRVIIIITISFCFIIP